MSVVKRGYQVSADAATHMVHISMHILQNLSTGHLISRLGDVAFPARSLELTALDFFL